MTRVQRLELTHFRGIRQLTLDFTGNVTVLVGVDGAGKTSILEALRALLAYLLYETALQTEGRPGYGEPPEGLKPRHLQVSDIQITQQDMSLTINALVEDQLLEWSVEVQPTLPGKSISRENIRNVITFTEAFYPGLHNGIAGAR